MGSKKVPRQGDRRSCKIALVAHCLLNQNSVVPGLARAEGAVREVVEALLDSGVGIVQLPCPETTHSGLRRFWQVKEQYSSAGFRNHCRRLAEEVADYVSEYVRNGYEIVAVVGVAGSPSCGIRETTSSPTWYGDPAKAGRKERKAESGVFMEELLRKLGEVKALDTAALIDIDHRNLKESVEALKKALHRNR